jgi:pyruvate dehydrogenase E1 component
MFVFQRIGDLAWAAGDSQCRGFLIGGTSGRTTLAGEGLQHQDGHSQIHAAFIPNCIAYDPTYAYELAVIVQDGMRRMYQEHENVFYYITVLNENYSQPELPKGAEEGIVKGMYLLREGTPRKKKPKVQLLGCGSILREVIAGANLLEKDFGIATDIWSVPGINVLRRDGLAVQRWNMLHPGKKPRLSYIETCLKDRPGPVVAATDYMKLYADQLRPFIPCRYLVLGTDGYGRSDTRVQLRKHFEVNRYYVAVTALKALAEEGAIQASTVAKAIKTYELDPEKPNPVDV